MGDFHFVSTLLKNLCPGMPPSRANANIMRELEVTEKVLGKDVRPIIRIIQNRVHPQKNMHPMMMTFRHVSEH